MSDNTASAKKKIEGHRAHIRTHIEKYKRYREDYEKQNMVKQIQNAQHQISDLRRKHPSISGSDEDTWRP